MSDDHLSSRFYGDLKMNMLGYYSGSTVPQEILVLLSVLATLIALAVVCL
jgi:hypothetical protein